VHLPGNREKQALMRTLFINHDAEKYVQWQLIDSNLGNKG